MLNDSEKRVLLNYRITEEEMKDIESFDEGSHLVTYKDGTQRRLADIMCRPMGYLANKNLFNDGKVSEFEERKWFTEKNATKKLSGKI